jgi:hypothetical protein
VAVREAGLSLPRHAIEKADAFTPIPLGNRWHIWHV